MIMSATSDVRKTSFRGRESREAAINQVYQVLGKDPLEEAANQIDCQSADTTRGRYLTGPAQFGDPGAVTKSATWLNMITSDK